MTTTKTSARIGHDARPKDAASGRSNGSHPTTSLPEPMTTASGGSLTELIDAALAKSDESDPHVIGRRYFAKLSPEQIAELALVGFVDRISRRMATHRTEGVGAPVVGRSKWQIANRVWVDGAHKLLAECDLSDLTTLAAQHREIAAKNLNRAEEYERLADELRASGVATVGEMWAAKDLAA